MSRRIDLSEKHDNSNFHANRNTHPFLYENDESEDNELLKENGIDDNATDNSYDNNTNYYSDDSYDESYQNEEPINSSPKGIYGIRNSISNAINKRRENNRSGIGNTINSGQEEIKEEATSAVVTLALKNPVVKKVILIAIPIILFIILIAFLIAAIASEESNSGLATSGYYAMTCPEVTVIFVDKDNDYAPIGTETFPLEEYVAGVIRGEVLGLHNIEIYKEMAILARTYLIHRAINHGCTVESSARNQVFKKLEDKPQYSDMVYEAVEATKGQVLLQNNEIISAHYDAFCSIAVDDQYYTIKQANQKIPRSWVDSQPGIADSWKQGTCAGNHGMGVSQWGSYYLATEKGYKYDEILKFYYGDEVTISTGSFATNLVGLEIKDTTNAQTLYTPLSTYLPSKGTSVEELNQYIYDSVVANGVGTRAGVVAAAVSLINFLYDGAGVKLPYYWGGEYQHKGINPNFGGTTKASSHGQTHASFDCSGFVSWAIYNGGYNFSRLSTTGFERRFGSDGCYINDSSCIGQPGDLINESGVHVQLIVSVDEAKGVYYIAESSYGVIIHAVGMHAGSSNRKILHMDNFYNNTSNINYNY